MRKPAALRWSKPGRDGGQTLYRGTKSVGDIAAIDCGRCWEAWLHIWKGREIEDQEDLGPFSKAAARRAVERAAKKAKP